MRKLLILLAAMVAAALSAGSALAQNANGGTCGFGATCNGGIANGANATGGQGGAGGAGGNAAASATAGVHDVGNVGNGFGNFSPSASSRVDNDIRTSTSTFTSTKQGQLQGQVNGNADNTQKTSLTFEAATIPDKYTIRNTPGVALGGLYPSAPCMGTSNIGGSGPGFSLGIGTSWTDKNCQIMETSRLAPTDADKVAVWCQSEFAANAPSCKAAAKKAEAEAPKVAEQSEKRKVSGQREAVSAARPTVSTVAKSDPYADYFSR